MEVNVPCQPISLAMAYPPLIRRKSEAIDAHYVKECLAHKPDSTLLVWLPRPLEHFTSEYAQALWNSRFAGKRAGSIRPDGYLEIRINGKLYMVHRIVWALANGAWPSQQLDHINGDRSDNRLENLREASNAENARNSPTPRNNTSGVKGVVWDKRQNKWAARIKMNGVLRNLGLFSDKGDAEIKVRAVRSELHGVFANHGTFDEVRTS